MLYLTREEIATKLTKKNGKQPTAKTVGKIVKYFLEPKSRRRVPGLLKYFERNPKLPNGKKSYAIAKRGRIPVVMIPLIQLFLNEGFKLPDWYQTRSNPRFLKKNRAIARARDNAIHNWIFKNKSKLGELLKSLEDSQKENPERFDNNAIECHVIEPAAAEYDNILYLPVTEIRLLPPAARQTA